MARRASVEIGGLSHANPIPAASRIGQLLFSSAITGRDPGTNTMPAGLSPQCANAFAHIRALMRDCGGSTDDIIKLNVHLADYRDREALNDEWKVMFPDPESRPARQVFAAALDGGALIHLDLVAVLEARVG